MNFEEHVAFLLMVYFSLTLASLPMLGVLYERMFYLFPVIYIAVTQAIIVLIMYIVCQCLKKNREVS